MGWLNSYPLQPTRETPGFHTVGCLTRQHLITRSDSCFH